MSTKSPHDSRSPILGCIADDVTGATDLAINLVNGGMRVVQILGVPDAAVLDHASDVDAVVVALKTRSVPAEDAVRDSVASLKALKSLAISRFYFKYCSTFDSNPQGNIGPVADALLDAVGASQTIFCPAFPRAGRTVYGGHLFVGEKLLNESGLENHPLNPMTDANLVRWLSLQTSRPVGLLNYQTVHQGRETIDAGLKQLANDGIAHVITDACDDSHLASLAEVAATMPLVTGGSGLARFLPAAWRSQGMLPEESGTPSLPCVSGRSAVISGSCSAATNAQVQWMKDKCATYHVDVRQVISEAAGELDRIRQWISSIASDQTLLIASTERPVDVSEMQGEFGRDVAAAAIEDFLGAVAHVLTDEYGIRRLIVAGGETSGAVMKRLNVRALRIGPEICAGVPWTETIGREPALAIALKSGNFGSEDFFESALEMLS